MKSDIEEAIESELISMQSVIESHIINNEDDDTVVNFNLLKNKYVKMGNMIMLLEALKNVDLTDSDEVRLYESLDEYIRDSGGIDSAKILDYLSEKLSLREEESTLIENKLTEYVDGLTEAISDDDSDESYTTPVIEFDDPEDCSL